MLTYEYIVYIVITILLHLAVLYFLTKKTKKHLVGRHVVITGGSSGIGLAAAIYCSKLGANVTIVARDSRLLGKHDNDRFKYKTNLNIFCLIPAKALGLISKNASYPEVQHFQHKSFDLSTSSYRDTCIMLNETEEISGSIYMLVNCAGMAICGKCRHIMFKSKNSRLYF